MNLCGETLLFTEVNKVDDYLGNKIQPCTKVDDYLGNKIQPCLGL